MSTEPIWPELDAVLNGHVRYECKATAERVIDMCREAWRIANDDPSRDPVGTVRRFKSRSEAEPRGNLAVRNASDGWFVIGNLSWDPAPDYERKTHAGVVGWPIIGAVPGTPAAEAKP